MKAVNIAYDDIDEITILLNRCFNEMQYEDNGYTFDEDSIKDNLAYWLKNGIVVVTRQNYTITGVGVVFIIPSFMDRNNIRAIEAAWHSDPLLPKIQRVKIMYALLYKMEMETKKRNIKYLHVSESILYPSICKILGKQGYKITEKCHLKEVI